MIRFTRLLAKCFGPFQEVELSLDGRGLVLIRGENNDTTSANSNGAGKTTIFRALTWALHGDVLERMKGDKVISFGQKAAEVVVEWSDDDGDWSVQRWKGRGQTMKLVLSHNSTDVSGQVIADTQAEIHRRLGMDYKTWRNTVMYAQGDVTRFADPETTDTERKAILKEILRLGVYDLAADQVKKRLARVEADKARLANEMAQIDAELRGLDQGDTLEQQATSAEAEAKDNEKKARRLPQWREVAGQIREMMDGLRVQLTALDGERDIVAKQAAEIERAAQREALRYTQEAAQASQAAAVARITSGNHGVAASKLHEEVRTFKDGKCPTCGTKATAAHIKQKIAALEAAAATQETAEAEALSLAQGHDARVTTLKGKAAEATRFGQTEARQVLAQHATASQEARAAIGAELETWRGKDATVQREITLAEQAGTLAATARRRAQECRARLAKLGARRGELSKATTAKTEELEALSNEHQHLSYWAKGFSNSGLPSFLMDAIVPELTERANRYLEILSDGDIKVVLDTQSTLKSGDKREKLSISWTIEGVPDVTPSGGQAKKISIAVGLGMMDIVATRERAAVDLLLLDEVLDGLDDTGKSRIMALLDDLRQRRSSVFVVSHDNAIQELFEHVITVRKTGRTAELLEEAV